MSFRFTYEQSGAPPLTFGHPLWNDLVVDYSDGKQCVVIEDDGNVMISYQCQEGAYFVCADGSAGPSKCILQVLLYKYHMSMTQRPLNLNVEAEKYL